MCGRWTMSEHSKHQHNFKTRNAIAEQGVCGRLQRMCRSVLPVKSMRLSAGATSMHTKTMGRVHVKLTVGSFINGGLAPDGDVCAVPKLLRRQLRVLQVVGRVAGRQERRVRVDERLIRSWRCEHTGGTACELLPRFLILEYNRCRASCCPCKRHAARNASG